MKLDYGVDSTTAQNEVGQCLATRSQLWRKMGNTDLAESDLRAALEIRKKVYAPDKFPNGHRDLVMNQSELGIILDAQGRQKEAIQLLVDAFQSAAKLYPQDEYPNSHVDLVKCANNMSVVYDKLGDNPKAIKFAKYCVESNGKLYSEFPHGHLNLFYSFRNLGNLLAENGDIEQGLDYLLKACSGLQKYAAVVTSEVSEGEAHNFTQLLPSVENNLLTYWTKTDRPDSELYNALWTAKGIKTGVYADRFTKLRKNDDPRVHSKYKKYLGVRQKMSVAYASTYSTPALLKSLNFEKEELERVLNQLTPDDKRQDSNQPKLQDLRKSLPENSIVIEFFVYRDSIALTPKYAAFIIEKHKAAKRIDLGDAAVIDNLLKQWREWIADTNTRWKEIRVAAKNGDESTVASLLDADTSHDDKLCELIWKPIEANLPGNCQRLYLIPDGNLHFLPFGAIPDKSNRFLVEEYEILVAPSGPWLATQFGTNSGSSKTEVNKLFAVGGVLYDEPTIESYDSFSRELFLWKKGDALQKQYRRQDERFLAGSVVESRYAMHCAGNSPKLLLEGNRASFKAVYANLPEATCAILSTHGGYDPRNTRTQPLRHVAAIDSRFALRSRQFVSTTSRNPFLKSNLSLAGKKSTEPAGPDLTAFQVASMPLEKLHWVLLSACQTSLGDMRLGEEVYGLNTAFHVAGVKNVVASLWSVPDAQTTHINMVFLNRVLQKKQSPALAFREAQLQYLSSPKELSKWDGITPLKNLKSVRTSSSADKIDMFFRQPYYWAGFQMSGTGY